MDNLDISDVKEIIIAVDSLGFSECLKEFEEYLLHFAEREFPFED